MPLARIVRITKGTVSRGFRALPLTLGQGAYIISPLEEASRDPIQNAGFIVSWSNTSRNSSEVGMNSSANGLTQLPLAEDSRRAVPTGKTPALLGQRHSMPNLYGRFLNPVKPSLPPSRPQSPFNSDGVSFSAFKVLPVDPFRVRSESTVYGEPADGLVGATTCKEVADLTVDAIKRACQKAGNDRQDNFVVEGDIVRLVCFECTQTMMLNANAYIVWRRHSEQLACMQKSSTV